MLRIWQLERVVAYSALLLDKPEPPTQEEIRIVVAALWAAIPNGPSYAGKVPFTNKPVPK